MLWDPQAVAVPSVLRLDLTHLNQAFDSSNVELEYPELVYEMMLEITNRLQNSEIRQFTIKSPQCTVVTTRQLLNALTYVENLQLLHVELGAFKYQGTSFAADHAIKALQSFEQQYPRQQQPICTAYKPTMWSTFTGYLKSITATPGGQCAAKMKCL